MNRLNGYLDSFVDQAGYRQHGGIWSGISRGDTVIASSGFIAFSGYRNLQISAFGGSGKIEYRGGPNEGWYASSPWGLLGGPLNDGMRPIALSGLYGINDAYKANNTAFLNATFGDINLIGNTRKTVFVPGSRSPMRISGVLFAPVNTGNTNNEQGDLMACLHGVIKPVPKFTGSTMNSFADPATTEEMTARAMGIGTLFLNTGSGITNIAVGSGIAQWNFTTYAGGDTFPLSVTKETFTRLPISTERIGDLNYSYATGPTGIGIFSPGLYRCSYSCTFRRVTINATLRTAAIRAVLKQQGINPSVPGISSTDTIPQSHSYCTAGNANVPCCSAHHSFLFNADAGDLIALEAALSDATATTDGLNLTTSGTLIMLEKIGPKRGNFS